MSSSCFGLGLLKKSAFHLFPPVLRLRSIVSRGLGGSRCFFFLFLGCARCF